MKKLVFLFAVSFGALVFTSCSKDEVQENQIITESEISQLTSETDIPLELRSEPITASMSADRKFLECLRGLNLSEEQMRSIRMAMNETKRCRTTTTIQARTDIKELNLRVEARRKNLKAQLEAGEITQEEFEANMQELRKFTQERRESIKENLRAGLGACTTTFQSKVGEILSPEQAQSLRDCLGR